MDNLILSQMPLSELIACVRLAVREELALSTTPNEAVDTAPPITTKELCKYLNITEPTVIRYRQKGIIPFFQIGSAVRFNLKEVESALNNKKLKNHV